MHPDSPALGLPGAGAVPRLGSACVVPVARGCSPCCTITRLLFMSSLQAFCPCVQTFLYLMAPTMLKKQCKCLAELQADCDWMPAKARGWGGYKFLLISCVTWPHRELAAGPTDKSSCPNLPPAFCPSSGLFTHSGQWMLLPYSPSSPALSHKQSSQKT